IDELFLSSLNLFNFASLLQALVFMATIGDSFLADLDDLSDNENDLPKEDEGNADDMEEDLDGDMADIENLNYDDLDSVSKLQKTQRYIDIMQ
ncbi:U4/U6 small nuclear ribonucleoprotein Prp31-like protein, partial [Thalictrum thalictroides]